MSDSTTLRESDSSQHVLQREQTDGHTSFVRDPKQPKTRPPKGLRDSLPLINSLPNYTGPYSVGTMELEIPVREPRHFSHLRRDHTYMLDLKTVLMTVYYPSAFGTGQGRPPSGARRWSRETWLPRPRAKMAGGYGKFGGIGPLALPFFGLSTWFTKLPAFRNAALATHWPPFENYVVGGAAVKNQAGPAPEGHSAEPVFPLMLFSHGLGGTRTMYSGICGEFASYGFIVCAVEHRDGSGPRTFINEPRQSAENMGEKMQNDDTKKGTKSRRRKEARIIDYYFPKGNEYDTSPMSDQGVDQELRGAQIDMRIAEIEEAYHVMSEISSGKGEEMARLNLRKKGFVGASSHGLEGIDWTSWRGRVLTTNVAMVGHSFGAATTVEILRNPDRFNYIGMGIIYDIWSAGIKAADPNDNGPNGRIALPLLALNSEAFAYWSSNFELVRKLVEEARAEDALAWNLTIRGTIHLNHSDFPLLYPHLCSYALKMTVDPQRCLDISINSSLEFLQKVLPDPYHVLPSRALRTEGILDLPIIQKLDDIPEEQLHKPENDKWLAARLVIPNELHYRFDPREVLRRRKVRKNRGQPLDESVDSEIWMHNSPSDDLLRKHGLPVPQQPRHRPARDDEQPQVRERDASAGVAQDDKTMRRGAQQPTG